ncbi:mCG148433 [Mus musculus]|nr:mCG148433 [Mus musculus]
MNCKIPKCIALFRVLQLHRKLLLIWFSWLHTRVRLSTSLSHIPGIFNTCGTIEVISICTQ